MSIHRPFARLGGALALCVLVGSDRPAAQPAAAQVLTKIKTLKCTFSLMAAGNWKSGGEPVAEIKPAKLSLGYDSIDTEEGTAHVTGGIGPGDIVVRLSGDALHLLEVGSSSPIAVTSVFARESQGGKLKAVHTRHEYTDASVPGFTSKPEQYYGECQTGP